LKSRKYLSVWKTTLHAEISWQTSLRFRVFFFSGPNLAWDKVLTQSFQTTKAKYAWKRRKERNRVKGKHRVSQVTTGYNCCCSAANTVLELCGIMKMIRYVKWMHSIISSKYTHIHIIARTSWQDPKKRENIFSIIISGQFGIGMFWLDNWLLTTDNRQPHSPFDFVCLYNHFWYGYIPMAKNKKENHC